MASTLVEITVLLLVLVLPLFGPAKKRRKKMVKNQFSQKISRYGINEAGELELLERRP